MATSTWRLSSTPRLPSSLSPRDREAKRDLQFRIGSRLRSASHPLHSLPTTGSRLNARPRSPQRAEADRAAPANAGRQGRTKRSPSDGRRIPLISHGMSGENEGARSGGDNAVNCAFPADANVRPGASRGDVRPKRGEIAALKRRSVDLLAAQLSVSESVEQTSGGVRIKETKSGRSISVSHTRGAVHTRLASFRMECIPRSLRSASGARRQASLWICTATSCPECRRTQRRRLTRPFERP